MKIDLSSEGTKARYLQAGLALFSEFGYSTVSVRDIAKKAGTSEAALYRHFKSKEEMALYLFTLILKKYTEHIETIAKKEDSSIERLCEIQRYTYNFYQQDPESVRFALLSQYQFWDHVEDRIKPHFWLHRLLNEGVEKGEIEEKPAYLWISLYSGLLLEPLIQHSFFHESLPEWEAFTQNVSDAIQKLLTK